MSDNLAQLAEDALQRLGERRSLNFEGQWVTNAQTLGNARRLQTAFAELGVGKGDIVALCMVNHPLVYAVFQGVFRSGGAAVPVMFQLTEKELQFVLEDTRAVGVVTDSFNQSKVFAACEGLDHDPWVVVLDPSGDLEGIEGARTLDSLLERPESTSLPNIAPEDLALLLYTSGTTGKPKGAMLSHRNLIASARQSQQAAEVETIETPRRTISAMPMAHIFGVGVMNGGYLAPERLADGYMVQHVWFEPERFMAGIEEHRCQSMPAVPTMLSLILNHPKVNDYDLSSLEEVVCGASPLPVEVAKTFMERYDCRVREIYGMTESAGMGSANRSSDPFRPGSAGRPYDETEVRIVSTEDDAGHDALPAGESGEIVVRGPSVMMGYLNRPDATAETIRDGWLHTGDVGYLDEDGFLFIVDRKKDMIIRGGENIYPAEIESTCYEHGAVAEAAVVGVPDPTYGEKVVAFVVRSPGARLNEGELRSFLKSRMTKFKVPSEIEFLDALPKSGVGKILRRELRDVARERYSG